MVKNALMISFWELTQACNNLKSMQDFMRLQLFSLVSESKTKGHSFIVIWQVKFIACDQIPDGEHTKVLLVCEIRFSGHVEHCKRVLVLWNGNVWNGRQRVFTPGQRQSTKQSKFNKSSLLGGFHSFIV